MTHSARMFSYYIQTLFAISVGWYNILLLLKGMVNTIRWKLKSRLMHYKMVQLKSWVQFPEFCVSHQIKKHQPILCSKFRCILRAKYLGKFESFAYYTLDIIFSFVITLGKLQRFKFLCSYRDLLSMEHLHIK